MPTSIPTIQELVSEKTREEVFDELAQAVGDEGESTEAWEEGEPLRAFMSGVARVLAGLWNSLAIPAISGGFLDYASGAWLTLLAWTTYRVRRKGKEFATRALTVDNRSLSFMSIAVGQVRIKNTAGKTFTNTSALSLSAWIGSGAYPSGSLTFRADQAGTDSDTAAGEIVTSPVTGPSGLYVHTNTGAILGSDEEQDDSLRERCRLSQAPLSPAGPWDAYRAVALSTLRPDGTPIAVTRVRVVKTATAVLSIFLASRSGPTPGSMGSAGSDVFLAYAAFLKSVVPTGFTISVFGAPVVSHSIVITLYVDVDSGLTAAEAVAAAAGACAEYVSKVPIGGNRKVAPVTPIDSGYLFVDEIAAKASESATGIIKAEHNAISDIVIPYNKIPDIAFTISAVLVKQ